MIRSVFCQNIDDPLWLAYLDHFVDEVEEIYNAADDTINAVGEVQHEPLDLSIKLLSF